MGSKRKQDLIEENRRLRVRAEQAEEALELALKGELDAVMPTGMREVGISTRPENAYIFQTFIDEMSEGAVVTERDGTITYCNNSFLQLLGKPRKEVLGSPFSSYVADDTAGDAAEDCKEQLEHWYKEIRREKKTCGSMPILGADGRKTPVNVSLVPLDYQDVHRVCITLYNLSEERRREEQIVEEKEKFKTVFDHIGDTILIYSMEGEILEANAAAVERLGYARDKLVGKAITEIDGPRFSHQSHQWIAVTKEQGELIFDTEHVSTSGEPISTEVLTRVIRFQGREVILAVGRDITQRKKAEDELRKSEEFKRALSMTSPAAIIGVDSGEKVVFWNEACERIFGWSADEVMGKPLPTVPEDLQDEHAAITSRVAAGETIYGVEVERVRKGGERFPALLSVVPLHHEDGSLRAIIATVADLSELKRLEQQLLNSQKLEAIGRLAGGIAHDFNNMLMVIKGFAQIVRKKQEPGSTESEHLMEIERAVKRASELTHQLLAFSRKQELELEQVDLNTVLDAARKMLERLLGEQVRLSILPGEDVPLIRADVNQLHQIILNLATNARDAMPQGGELEYTVETAHFNRAQDMGKVDIESGHYVVLRVRDTGVGMEEETIAHLFEPFYTTKEVGKGTGLGLSTTYGTVKQLGGYIFCVSGAGQGTEFTLYFPAAEGEPAAEKRAEAPSHLNGDETILLVEDEEMVRTAIELTLREHGYTVLQAKNAEEAWRIFEEQQGGVDILISDIVMPGDSGVTLAERLRKEDPSLKLMFLTGYGAEHIQRSPELFARGWKSFKKPIEPDVLNYELRTLLDSS